MLATALSAAVLGVDAFEVRVEVDLSGGLPQVTVVGLPDAAVQESRERVRSALRNAGFPFPSGRVIVNLAPADVRKEGPAFDLPIALALLAAQGVLPQRALEEVVICGELALDGTLRPLRGAINIGLFAAQAGYPRALVPPANGPEVAAVIGIEVIAPATLREAVAFLNGTLALTPELPPDPVGAELPALDPFSGEPYRYRLGGEDGGAVVYSVGMNRVDDGGTSPPPEGKLNPAQYLGDLVWSLGP